MGRVIGNLANSRLPRSAQGLSAADKDKDSPEAIFKEYFVQKDAVERHRNGAIELSAKGARPGSNSHLANSTQPVMDGEPVKKYKE